MANFDKETNLNYNYYILEPHRGSGKLRVIAVGNLKRFAPLADVPTVAETLPGFEVTGFGVLAAPAGTPEELVQILNCAVDPVARDPDYVQKLHSLGLSIDSGAGTAQEIAQFLRRQRENWANIMRGVDFRPQHARSRM